VQSFSLPPLLLWRQHMNYYIFIALMMVAISTSETSVNFYETTLLNIPEDSHMNVVTFHVIYIEVV
jgi:hypothetical protein